MLTELGDAETLLGIDGTYPDAARAVASGLGAGLPRRRLMRYYYPGPRLPHGDPADGLRPIAEHIVRAAYASVSADVVHVNSLFEGFVEHAAGLGSLAGLPGAISSATLYDLIPLKFPDQYLVDPAYRAWYERKVACLSDFDVLLCLSEATKRDAIELLGIPEARLSVIHAGVADHFKPATDLAATRARVRLRFGIRGRFALYTGNDDYRKNIEGAVVAFAKVPKAARRGVQLVLNQVGDRHKLMKLARSCGLSADDVVITGRVSDSDLIELLQSCDVFFFPSLYEGFGLPLLEGMACGAPVIAGNNSSLPEVLDRADSLFDANCALDTARLLERVLVDDAFSDMLRSVGPARAAAFTWRKCAQASVQAWTAARARPAVKDGAIGPARRRIAVVTPLPPDQSGIADYAAEILPALAEHADVEVFTTANVQALGAIPVHPWTALPQQAARFDQVVYQFGNSPFHGGMADLIKDIPGVVVLHDFFLSSMYWHKQCHEGFPDVFRAELASGHGRRAVQVHDAGGEDRREARERYPACRSVVEGADAVIVHSAHSLALCRDYYPGIRRGPWSVLPMPIAARGMPGDDAWRAARQRLGIGDGELLLVSFGFMADTKLNLELLKALRAEGFTGRRHIRLVFVGQAAGGAYGERVASEIADHPLRDRIRITGFASAESYADYLAAADIAIQLRTGSRGETSKAVLDCLAHGLPLIVNTHGSFAELPDDVVVKVPDQFSAPELTEALAGLIVAPSRRTELSSRAKQHVLAHHAPGQVAVAYLAAIEASLASRRERTGQALVSPLVDGLIAAGGRDDDLFAIEHALAETVEAQSPGRLLVDLSEVVANDYGTGIHRVVRNLARELALCDSALAAPVRLVAHTPAGDLVSAEAFGEARLGLPRSADAESGWCTVQAGDDFFMLDSAWENPERFLPTIARVRAKSGRNIAMLYDLIPLRFPQYCVDFMPKVFEYWLRFIVRECDVILCISRTVADDLAAWIASNGAEHRPGLAIGHNLLGSDLDGDVAIGAYPTGPGRTQSFLESPGPVTLMVGTVEPRKRHDLALDAFETLWRAGSRQRLLIVGRPGWNVDALMHRINHHPELGKRLRWLEDASDAELAQAYAGAERVLMASDAEGFGLPIIEAARHGRPLLLSGIDVFREIAGDAADYFAAGDAADLAQALGRAPRPMDLPTDRFPDWAKCAHSFFETLGRGRWDHVHDA
ncbi:hypothetical protein N787_03965 [Arenimonas metalli CF5-1]|uniref:Glycosyl transferase family 1 domain-containing protein n=1 Tax=Arenimonas metalli CF5-1 TaxID=1384056 RepID=A0A091ASI6_9GAMM|nr:hypothetical protein N787_03965 [Arenimonas metalli CF5-1]